MQKPNNIFLKITVGLLFLLAPFVMTTMDSQAVEILGASSLPGIVPTVASALRWLVFGVLLYLSLSELEKGRLTITLPVILLSFFYLTQLFYAIGDGEDIPRFFSLLLISIALPPMMGLAINDKGLLKFFCYCILFFIAVSIVLNGHLVLAGQRFMGFMTNANSLGISTVFWLVILLMAKNKGAINQKFFLMTIVLISITMFFTGSRNALAGSVIILFIYYRQHLTHLLGGLLLIVPVFILLSFYMDISFLTDRFTNISGAAADSGREEIWESAWFMIENNFWWGNGMNANYEISSTGNMHNVYVRFMLNMGMIFTVITLTFYLLSMVTAIIGKLRVPLLLPGYLLVYALMNLGEDFFVGLGSSAFIYMLFIYAFINSYKSENNNY